MVRNKRNGLIILSPFFIYRKLYFKLISVVVISLKKATYLLVLKMA
jgi:hypothetical protein